MSRREGRGENTIVGTPSVEASGLVGHFELKALFGGEELQEKQLGGNGGVVSELQGSATDAICRALPSYLRVVSHKHQ